MTNIEPTPRDPHGTDPHRHNLWDHWPFIVGVVLAAVVAIAVFATMTTPDHPSVTNSPTAPPSSTQQP